MKIQKKSLPKKPLLLALAIAVLLGAGFAYAYNATDIFTEKPAETGEISGINLDPPTEEEIKEGQNAKERILEEGEQEDQAGGNDNSEEKAKKPVTIGVSYAGITDGQLEIRAFSPEIITGAGTCTATVSKPNSPSITESTPAFIDASSTICQPIYIPRSKLSAGSWNINVTFSSPTHEGSSGATKVEVQ